MWSLALALRDLSSPYAPSFDCRYRRIALGFLPGGSGNSIMCDFGTWDMERAAKIVATGEVIKMDVNMVETMDHSIAR